MAVIVNGRSLVLSVDFKVEMQHWRLFVTLAQRRPFGWWGLLFCVAVGLVAAAATKLLGLCQSCDFDEPSLGAGVLCGVIAYPVIGYVFNRLFVGSQVKLGGSVLGDRKLKLTPESLELDGPNFRSVFAWTAVEGTTADKHLLVLWMDRAAGIFIPTSAFASKSDEKVFKDFVDERTAQKR